MAISRLSVYGLEEVQKGNLTSIGKTMREGWTPSFKWCEDQLHAQHSTLELCSIVVEATVSGTVASHIVRHTKAHPRFVVESRRPDWTGKPRPPASEERRIYMCANPLAWIEMARQRLCRLASDETRKFYEEVFRAMESNDSPMLKALGLYAAPDCLYRGGTCHMHEKSWAGCKMVPHWRTT